MLRFRNILRRPVISMQTGLRAVLALQVGIALLLLLTNIADGAAPRHTSIDPEDITPVAPGDQRRVYSPASPGRDYTKVPSEFQPPERDMSGRLDISSHVSDNFGRVLMLSGPIGVGDSGRIEAALADLDTAPDLVALDSPGGLVNEALQIGRMLREMELDTAVLSGSRCFSSCPYALSGGVMRLVSRTGAVGVHQHYYDAPGYMPVYFAVEDIQTGQAETMAHLIDLGIDPELMMYALRTPPDEIYILVEEELENTAIATRIIP